MTMREIAHHERLGMYIRSIYGYDQYDDHIWRWLNYELLQWSMAHPISVRHT